MGKRAKPQEPVPNAKCGFCSGTGEIVVQHGTLSGYKNHKCRCGPCQDAHRAYLAEYVARRVG